MLLGGPLSSVPRDPDARAVLLPVLPAVHVLAAIGSLNAHLPVLLAVLEVAIIAGPVAPALGTDTLHVVLLKLDF